MCVIQYFLLTHDTMDFKFFPIRIYKSAYINTDMQYPNWHLFSRKTIVENIQFK